MSIKLDTQNKLLDAQGKETNNTVGRLLAEVLWNSRTNQARSHLLAKKLQVGGTVDLLAEDVVFVKKAMSDLGVRAGDYGQVVELLGETSKEE